MTMFANAIKQRGGRVLKIQNGVNINNCYLTEWGKDIEWSQRQHVEVSSRLARPGSQGAIVPEIIKQKEVKGKD